jgi:DNA-binding protein H-NS
MELEYPGLARYVCPANNPRDSRMKKINLDAMSYEELTALRKDVDIALKSLSERKRKAALDDIGAILKKHGLSMSEVIGTEKKPAKAKGGAARFRHPENPALTWSGHGRQPAWYREAIEKGAAPADMQI